MAIAATISGIDNWSCRIYCKLTGKRLFQPEAPGDGDGAATGIVEEVAGAGEIAEAEAQANPLMEETEVAAEAHEAEVWESGT
jgi:hypothetical protein